MACREAAGKKLKTATYAALKGMGPMPLEALRVQIARRFGWTLEYVDGLDMEDIVTILAVWEAEAAAGAS